MIILVDAEVTVVGLTDFKQIYHKLGTLGGKGLFLVGLFELSSIFKN